MKKLIESEMNDKRYEFMYKTLKISKLPNIIAIIFVLNAIAKTKALPDKDQQKGSKVKSLLYFIQNLIKMGKFQLAEIAEEIKEFCEAYRDFEEAETLSRLLVEI